MKSTNSKANNSFERTALETALFSITERAVSAHDIKDYARELHAIIKRLMYAENFFIALYEQDNSLVNFIYIVDQHEAKLEKSSLSKLGAEELRRTATGYMLRTARSQHLSMEKMNQLRDENIIDSVGGDSYDWLGVPLKYQDQVLGGIVIQSYDPEFSYGSRECDILEFVASQIALVMKSKQSEIALMEANQTLERRVSERTEDLNHINAALEIEIEQRKKSQSIQASLYQISELVSTTVSLNELYRNVHEIIKQLMHADNEYIALISEDGKYVEFPYFKDEFDESPQRREIQSNTKDRGFTERVMSSGKTFLYHREDEETGIVGTATCESWLGVPLKDNQRVFGVLAVQSYRQDEIYTKEHLSALNTIGQQVANAILRKKHSDSLIQAHENLERRVRERTFELEETIEKRKIVEKKLEHESLHDALTGLPNRLHLSNELNRLLSETPPHRSQSMALLFLDLDRFKIINDSLGHHIGDLFLIEVANRLKHCLRSDDMVARLGGDEFCVLMPNITTNAVALKLCSRILKELKKNVEVANHALMTSASIGVRLANTNEDSAEEIMSDADAAMYRAKQQGKNRFCLFDATIKSLVTNRMKMERDLRDAVDEGQLFLVYQPIVNIREHRVEGFEALVRWQHPESGLISPAEFIPVAEETGLIVDIGEGVVEEACKMLAKFKQEPIMAPLYVNVNVSSLQILARTLDDFIRKNLVRHKLNSRNFNVEITESILIEDYKAAMAFVREMKSMDVRVYLDDFGTGYSSLSYLHKFPFDVIKLDQSFISALDESETNNKIVESIGILANNLGIRIVAEGIESQSQLETILPMNYDVAQGYLFSKPLAEDELITFVKNF